MTSPYVSGRFRGLRADFKHPSHFFGTEKPNSFRKTHVIGISKSPELLQSERVEELFAELRKRYDYILVDTAPVALVSDTYQLDRIADMTLFVCRYKHTPNEMIDYINNVIDQQRMHNVACVLNGIRSSNTGYGYGAKKS